MKKLVPVLALVVLPALVSAEEMWRWKDANGTRCYSNIRAEAPATAEAVDTHIVIEAKQLPGAGSDLVVSGGKVTDAANAPAPPPMESPVPLPPLPKRGTKPIYGPQRLAFGCFAGQLLFAGGWSHPDDIPAAWNCLPYTLGPEAWLNSARAELGIREHGIDTRSVVNMFYAAQPPPPPVP